MVTAQHTKLMDELESLIPRNWGEAALLACLRKLRDGGPTEYRLVEVRSAHAVEDGFDIVYLSPWGPEVGLRAREGEMQYFAGIYQKASDFLEPEEFGYEIADFYVAEPLGAYGSRLEFDEAGLGWWGAGRAQI